MLANKAPRSTGPWFLSASGLRSFNFSPFLNGNQLSKDCWAGSDRQQTTQWLRLLSHKILLKRGDQSVHAAHWNLTTSKVPPRDPGSPENRSLQPESKKATTKQDTMKTLGQPAMEEKCYLRFNCWRKRKEKGSDKIGPGTLGIKAGGVPWQSWPWHKFHWAEAVLRLDPNQRLDRRSREEPQSGLLPHSPAGPSRGITDPEGNAIWVTVFACLFPWSSHCECCLVVRVS